MRISRLLPLLLATFSACNETGHAPPPAADTTHAPVTAAISSTNMLTVVPPAGGAIGASLDSSCTRAANIAHDALNVALARDTASSFAAPRDAPAPRHGCRYTASGHVVQSPNGRRATPDGLLQSAYIAAGWTQDLAYNVDGPDGAELGMRRGEVLCHLAIAYPGVEVPDDPDVAPPPSASAGTTDYTLELRCARSPARVPA